VKDHSLLHRRLLNQRVTGRPLAEPQDVVKWLGAVQSQDYAAAKWALAQRMARATDAGIDEAFGSGAILRTHVMRPTWHFVVPEDIRWLLQLTGPRVNALCGTYYRKMELDDRVAAKSHAALAEALKGGRQLTRQALKAVLQRARVLGPGDGPLRLGFILMRAELDGVVCSGPRHGKEFTYALLEERVPRARPLSREDSLAELVKRYFTSHGPATAKDFAWWSGLTVADTRAGLEMAASTLASETRDGQTYWAPIRPQTSRPTPHSALLLPAYDEALLSYRDNRAAYATYMDQLYRDNGQTVVIDGRPVGTWRRTIKKDRMTLQVSPFARFDRRQTQAVAEAADRYGGFLNLATTVIYGSRDTLRQE
jgi:hypothetical protein